jgi:hypothetical protein
MRKPIIGLLAAALVALFTGPVLAMTGNVPRAHAGCWTSGGVTCCAMPYYSHCTPIAPRMTQPARPAQPIQPARPVQPAPHPAPTVPVQAPPPIKPVIPAPPPVVPVMVTPKINPPIVAGPPHNSELMTAPKNLGASPQAVTAAKSAPAMRIDPANPPKPPTQTDFKQQVQNVVNAHSNDVVKADNQSLARPHHWDFVDYDNYHRPNLYNPLDKGMTFRYFDHGAYREAYVPAGGRLALDAATPVVYPFTAVGDDYLAAGSFFGGGFIPPLGWDGPPPADWTPPPGPEIYHDISAFVPAAEQAVQVGQVTVVGHDDSLPTGSQDTFLLDDSTLAWGQINAPGSKSQINVTKTQSLPSVGPIDNGSYLVQLAAHEQPAPADNTWWLWPLVGIGLVIAAGVVAWLYIRRKRDTDLMDADTTIIPV